ncbi:uncharacterized protein [Panulirus ornatus]|uniref:uncharacterized protein n=1 Tax=Panulirus ornatus TaxID=150431 RepID=UPI003A8B1B4B
MTTTRTPTSHTTTPVSPISTKKPSRWRSWLSSVGSRISVAAQNAKDELAEAKEAYGERMANVGRAIMAGGNATKEGFLGAGRAIKRGAKRIGTAIKAGFRKVRLKFAGTGEKFRIVANRLKEKLEAGDGRALALMEKLGINVVFFGNRITGSSVENNSLPVSEILKNEGRFSNESALHNTSVESISADLSLSTAEEHPPKLEDMGMNVTISDEDLYPSPGVVHTVESALAATRSTTSEVIGDPTIDTNQPVTKTTTLVPTTITQLSTGNIHPVTTTFHSASATHLSRTTRLPPTTASTAITQPSTTIGRSARTTHSSTTTSLPSTTPPSMTTTTTSSTTTILPKSTTQSSTTTRFRTTVPPLTTETQKTTTDHLKTSPHPSTTPIKTSLTTAQPLRTTTTFQPTFTRTSSPATTTLPAVTTRRTLGTDSTPDQPHVSLPPPEEPDRTEEEPYEPPPFPDVFNDIEVHDRLKDFYDSGGFTHAELTEIFNFDPDNYEYYYDYYD